MFDIITVGSATVDVFAKTDVKYFHGSEYCFPVGTKALIDELNIFTGGGGTNTAVGFSKLGLKTAFIGKIGRGANSDRILGVLKKAKVSDSLISRENGCTGYSVIIDCEGMDRVILAFKGSNNDLGFNDINQRKLKTKWFYFSSMVNRSFKTQERLASFAQKKGIKICYNPSSYLTVKGIPFLRNILNKSNILILNLEEAKMLVKGKSIYDLLSNLQGIGPEIVVITEGKECVHAFDGETFYHAKPHKIRIEETTGAGDAFSSGFLTGIIKKNDIEFALRLGMANAEGVIQKIGAKNGLLAWKDALSIIKKKHTKVVKRKNVKD